MDYALIENGVVVNIIRLNERSAHKFPNAVKYVNIPVGIGDTYADGVFYRDGVELLPEDVLAAEMNEAYQTQMQDMENALAILLGGETA